MRKYFKESDKKESTKKTIDIDCDIKFDDIKDCLEDVDGNGEEQGDNQKYKDLIMNELEKVEGLEHEPEGDEEGTSGTGTDEKKKKHKKKKK